MPSTPTSSVLRPHGTIIVCDVDGKETQADSLQCVHCGAHWVVVKGSGIRRGFCRNCMGPTCGADACCTCIPLEKKLEMVEAGKARFI
jgi:hypothetical protein